MTKARPIMIQGTMSNAGKSIIAAGLCRIFKQDGYRVAPFKSQNMALNSYITSENLEMGRAQVVQAQACGIEPVVAMNPILLKPTTDMGSQVIINGEVIGNMRAMDYFRHKREYVPVIRQAYEKLAAEYDIIVIEGAGSPAEINLKQDDIVNMGMAEIADAPVLLVGDIDRGGVFAQLIGTVMLLEPDEQDRIKGLIINKFRGDKKILEPGLSMITERCGKEVLGVVPWMDVDIEDEDSLAERLNRKKIGEGIDAAVIRLPRISNFTDFQALEMEGCVSVRYVERLSELGRPDVVILPGTKNTMKDMRWLRESGLEGAVKRLAKEGTPVFGICGGYQMLGEWIEDAVGAEDSGRLKGMGLLPMTTCFEPEKTRTRVSGKTGTFRGIFAPLSGKKVSGYEIHMGCSKLEEGTQDLGEAQVFGYVQEPGKKQAFGNVQEPGKKQAFGDMQAPREVQAFGEVPGYCCQNVMGTYLHGVFDEEEFRQAFVRLLCDRKGISYSGSGELTFEEYKEKQFDRLAQSLRESLDMQKIYEIMGLGGTLL